MNPKPNRDSDEGDLEETKRIMERLVRTPPKPHVKKSLTKSDEGTKEKDDGRPTKRDRRPD